MAGNVGSLTGPPFFAALSAAMGRNPNTLAVQGVDYPADIPGFLVGGSPQGSKTMFVHRFVLPNLESQTDFFYTGHS